MNGVFPFGFPGPTTLYLSLYAVTLVAHVVLLSYVLAGTGYVAIGAVTRLRGGERAPEPVSGILRDWLPFALGAAITAGVAPLLFLQILYKESFYTSSLLLFNRWMAIVPVLIIGFYALYLAKSARAKRWRPLFRAAIPMVAFGCFVFVAYSWTESHLLALDHGTWARFYVDGKLVYLDRAVPLRAVVWVGGAFPIMAAALAWQLLDAQQRGDDRVASAGKRLAMIAFGGLVVALVAAFAYRDTLSPAAREALTSPMARPYLIVGALGAVMTVAGWAWQLRQVRLARGPIALAGSGSLLMIVAAVVLREALRVASHDMERLAVVHRRASEAGGMPVFLFFLLLNGAAITWCFVIARRAARQSDAEGSS